jgi:hypothetical protein
VWTLNDCKSHLPLTQEQSQLPSRGEDDRVENTVNISNQGKVPYACFHMYGYPGKPLQAGSFWKDTRGRDGGTHNNSMYSSFKRQANDLETFEDRLEGQVSCKKIMNLYI